MALSKVDPNFLNVSQVGGRRNLLINGNMEVNQRNNLPFTSTGFNYGIDRWAFAKNDSVNYSASVNDFALGQTDVPLGKKYIEFTLNSAGSGTDFVRFEQRIEDVTTAAGQTVTISFWAKANTAFTADFDGAPAEPVVGIMQYFGTGGTPSSATNTAFTTSIALTTTWTKYTYTATLPSVSGKTVGSNNNDHLRVYLLGLMDDDAGKTVSLAQVQLEIGDTATPFEHRSYGEELSLCERYYVKHSLASYQRYDSAAHADTTSRVYSTPSLPTTMRTTPTISQTGLTVDGAAVVSIGNNTGSGNQRLSFVFNHDSSRSTGSTYQVYPTGSATVTYSAEL